MGLILIYVMWSAGIILLMMAFFSRSSIGLSARLKQDIGEEIWYRDDLIKKPLWITLPFRPLNRFILSKMGSQRIKDKLAFLEFNLLPEDFLGIKYLTTIGLLIAVYVAMKRLEPLWILGILLAGFVFPDLYMRNLIKKRKRLILRALPDSIDLLILCVEGGLDLLSGLNWVIKRSAPGPLNKEISLVLHEVRMGKSRHDALKAMARRVDVSDMFSFV